MLYKTTVLVDQIQRLRTYPTQEELALLEEVIELVKEYELPPEPEEGRSL